MDTKYANLPGFMSPYHNAPYDSNEFSSSYHPQNAKELFNQRHSLLRNAVDGTFAALKARFPILLSAPPYPLQTQVKLVVATCAIHNFIRQEKPDDWIFRMYKQGSLLRMEESFPPLEVEQQAVLHHENQLPDFAFEAEEIELSSQLRDSMVTEMWNDYINDISAI